MFAVLSRQHWCRIWLLEEACSVSSRVVVDKYFNTYHQLHLELNQVNNNKKNNLFTKKSALSRLNRPNCPISCAIMSQLKSNLGLRMHNDLLLTSNVKFVLFVFISSPWIIKKVGKGARFRAVRSDGLWRSLHLPSSLRDTVCIKLMAKRSIKRIS